MVNALLDKSAAMLIRQRNLLIPLISDDRGVLAKQDFFWPLAKMPSSHMGERGQERVEGERESEIERGGEGKRERESEIQRMRERERINK